MWNRFNTLNLISFLQLFLGSTATSYLYLQIQQSHHKVQIIQCLISKCTIMTTACVTNTSLAVSWLMGWSVGQSVGRLVGHLVSWLVGQSISRSVGRSVSRFVGWSVGRSVGLSVGLSVDESENVMFLNFIINHIKRYTQYSPELGCDQLTISVCCRMIRLPSSLDNLVLHLRSYRLLIK